jgi:Ca-activated chloride channel family protein
MTYGRRHYLTQQILVRLAYAGPSNAEVREFAKASLRFVVALSLIFFGLVALAQGQDLQKTPTAGEFLIRADDACEEYEAAIQVETRVRFDVTGVIARTVVTQRFRNPMDVWVEGVYVFPLPEGSAVDHLTMRVGDRVIEGQIREKAQARREFEAAATAGKRASLVEQQRPNLFTTRVANLGPNEELEVEIEYQDTLELEQGVVRLRFPLAITPRYAPMLGGPNAVVAQPPFLAPDEATSPVTIALNLDAGFDVASLSSPTHAIDVEQSSPRRFAAHLRESDVPTDRDLIIEWRALPGIAPQSSVSREVGPDGLYTLVSLFPPTGGAERAARLKRDVTFVIDTSGSMEGVSMAQAKKALALAIERLHTGDRFNVIQFNSYTSRLFETTVPVTDASRAQAVAYAEALYATGGTEMLAAINAALTVSAGKAAADDDGAVRQVIFLTDGAVSNEDELFAAIRARLGRSRLFTVGIGSAPNTHFMSKAAAFGRGTFTYISDVSEVEAKMTELFAKVESPALSDIEVSFDVRADAVEMWPARIPDLYMGEPLMVTARFQEPPTAIHLRGRRGGEPFEITAPFEAAAEGKGIGVLWARRKIQALLDGAIEGQNTESVREGVIELGLAHHLVTPHTSLVAVDVTTARPPDEAAHAQMIPVTVPAGSAFGTLPQSATPASLYLARGLAAVILALGVLMVTVRS